VGSQQRRCADVPMLVLEWETKLLQQRVKSVEVELKALTHVFKQLKALQAKLKEK